MRADRFLPPIEPHERRRVALAAAAFVCVAAGALIARTAGDALFLSTYGSGPLPWMYIAGSLAAAVSAVGCVVASRRLSTGHVAMRVAGVLVAANLLLYASFRAFPALPCLGAYLVADVSVRIPVLLFWAFASELFDPGESRRLFGLIGAAGTAACLPAGLLAGPLARRVGTESLLLVAASLSAGFVLSAGLLLRDERARRRPSGPAGPDTARASSARLLRGHQAFLAIAALAVVTSLVETLVDYQFKATAASTASSTALASLFGAVYAAASVASLFIQLLVVHRLLTSAGVLASLCVLPAGLLVPLAGVVRSGGAAVWAIATKTLDVTLATSVNSTARQLLYRGILPESRLTARALVDGLVQPLAVGLAGAGLALAAGVVSLRVAAAAAAAGCFVWLLSAHRAHAAYVTGLLDALKARKLQVAGDSLVPPEPAVAAWLGEAFASAPDEDLIHLAAVLPQLVRLVDPDRLGSALTRESPGVKLALLQALQKCRLPRAAELALPYRRHANPDVRRAAILAACTSAGTDTARACLEEAMGDPEPRVRAAAAALLADARETETRGRGQAELGEMIESEDPADRSAAAEALELVERRSAIHRKAWVRFVIRLLKDADEAVALAALETLRGRPDAALVLPALELLGRPTLAGAASDALVAMGPEAVGSLVTLLKAGGPVDRAARRRLPEVLERIGDPRALEGLEALPTPQLPEERTPLFRACARLAWRARAERTGTAHLDSLVLTESRAAGARLATMKRLGPAPPLKLLREAVSDLYDCHLENAFTLLEGRMGDIDMQVIRRRMTQDEGEERSQALELLHNLLPPGVREPLLELLETGRRGGDTDPRPESEVRALLSDRDSEWVVAGAAWAAGELPLRSCAEELEALCGHESPVVRETAAFALERLGGAA